MRWSKIKNIVILLLLLVNLFLLAMVGLRAWRSGHNERETRQRMVAVLEKSGIAFLPDEVPGDLTLSGWRITLQIPGEDEARLLLGGVTDVYTVGTRTVYEGGRGSVNISSSGEMEAKFEQGAFPLEEDDAGSAGLELLSRLGVQAQETERISQEGQTVLTYVQLWNGVPVPNRPVTLTCRDESWESLSLHWLAGTAESVALGDKTITASTALVRFLEVLDQEGYVCSQVTDMYAGYVASGTSTVTLTPAWYVETDEWLWKFSVDGYTGAVTTEG